MEVHTHTHTARKKWNHYFWEFFMLFLAVTLGFLVENQREHMVEHKREKEYIKSMVEDLKTDTASFSNTIKENILSCSLIDTLIPLLNGNKRKQRSADIYYLARFIPFQDPFLICQNKTYEQLKNSGGLRLIRSQDILNAISSYYQSAKLIETQGPTQMQYQNRRDLIDSYDLLFNAAVFHQMIHSASSRLLDRPSGNPSLLNDDPAIINKVCLRFHIMYSTKKVVIGWGKTIIDQATSLMQLLQKMYHLDQ